MKLSAWLNDTKTPDGDFARLLGISRVTLFRLKTGRRLPDRKVMERINTQTNGAVTPNDFFDIGETPAAPVTPAATAA